MKASLHLTRSTGVRAKVAADGKTVFLRVQQAGGDVVELFGTPNELRRTLADAYSTVANAAPFDGSGA